jgi:DDE family transposase
VRLEKAGWQYSIGVRMIKTVRGAVEAIDENAWQSIAYPDDGEAQIAKTTYGDRRLIVRRTRLLGAQAELWPDWRHFCVITNRTDELIVVEAEHREHAVVEQVIADLKDQALAHFPSGHFHANGAWTVLAAPAHNMLRWTHLLGLPDTTVRAARTLRRRLIQVPGRLTRHARRWTLHLPARWPWHGDYTRALNRIRALPVIALKSSTSPRHQAHRHVRPGHDHCCPQNPITSPSRDPRPTRAPATTLDRPPRPTRAHRRSPDDPPTALSGNSAQPIGGSGLSALRAHDLVSAGLTA